MLRSRIQTTPGTSCGGASNNAQVSPDLPVFEAHPGGDTNEGGDTGGARVVPPPIPERARPTDRYSYHEAINHAVF